MTLFADTWAECSMFLELSRGIFLQRTYREV